MHLRFRRSQMLVWPEAKTRSRGLEYLPPLRNAFRKFKNFSSMTMVIVIARFVRVRMNLRHFRKS